MEIKTVEELEKALSQGKYTSIGAPIFFFTVKGEALCYDAVVENKETIIEAIKNKDDRQWEVIGYDINWESRIYCDHTGDLIESAYGYTD